MLLVRSLHSWLILLQKLKFYYKSHPRHNYIYPSKRVRFNLDSSKPLSNTRSVSIKPPKIRYSVYNTCNHFKSHFICRQVHIRSGLRILDLETDPKYDPHHGICTICTSCVHTFCFMHVPKVKSMS